MSRGPAVLEVFETVGERRVGTLSLLLIFNLIVRLHLGIPLSCLSEVGSNQFAEGFYLPNRWPTIAV